VDVPVVSHQTQPQYNNSVPPPVDHDGSSISSSDHESLEEAREDLEEAQAEYEEEAEEAYEED
jgi:hypothetical protein